MKTWDLSGREFVLLGEMLPHTVHLWELCWVRVAQGLQVLPHRIRSNLADCRSSDKLVLGASPPEVLVREAAPCTAPFLDLYP